ncbi:CysZ protein [Pseudidiomarina indica]|uniref:Sulfate transporter CysZ n=2 Tax=Pseudidiomarina indica TaxID=1159017 RepID=A0A1G6AY13_9GAMM|nr:CysZ protein [Pseudidiomarina indica]
MANRMQTTNEFGGAYIQRGFELAFQRGLRRYVFIPLCINIVLFSVAIYYSFHYTAQGVDALIAWLPSFLAWLEWILWPLAVITLLLLVALTFTSIANLIASPFNSLLAEQVELRLSGQSVPDGGVMGMVRDIPRILLRELQKILYLIPRFIGFGLLLIFVPIIGQILWFLFGGWMMTIQYADYPFDNHKVPFKTMRRQLWQHPGKSLSFGCIVAVLASLPIINLLLIPVAVCGATAMWVDHHKNAVLS